MVENSEFRSLKTVEITCEVLRTIKELDDVTVTELSDEMNMSKGAAYNHLATLRKEGFLVKDNNKYKLSYIFLPYSEYLKNRSNLYNQGVGIVQNLAEETGESVNIMIEEYGKGIFLYKKVSQKGIASEFYRDQLENTEYLHWTAAGKAILANLPYERVEVIVNTHGLPRATNNSITEREQLRNELEEIRERGFALNDEEQVPGVRAIGAPVILDDQVLGALSLSGPISRIDDQKFTQLYPDKVMEAANIIEVSIETSSLANV